MKISLYTLFKQFHPCSFSEHFAILPSLKNVTFQSALKIHLKSFSKFETFDFWHFFEKFPIWVANSKKSLFYNLRPYYHIAALGYGPMLSTSAPKHLLFLFPLTDLPIKVFPPPGGKPSPLAAVIQTRSPWLSCTLTWLDPLEPLTVSVPTVWQFFTILALPGF